MGIDPQTIKQLLQLQIWSKSSLLNSGGTASGSDGESEFSGLLNSLLDGQQIEPTHAAGLRKEERTMREPIAATAAKRMAAASWNRYRYEDAAAGGTATEFEPVIREASRKFGVEASLVKAVIDAESSFNSRAVSRAGAKGLMQLMDGTGKEFGVFDPFDPKQNIEGGTNYLSNLLMKYNGNHGAALAAYNAGPGRLDKLGIKNDQDLAAKLHLLPEETQQYVRKVMQLKNHYEA